MIKIRKCKQCGKEFEATGRSKFCSKSCITLYVWDNKRKRTRVKRICERCGKEYFLAGYYKDDKKRGKYCSRECYLTANNERAKRHICEICGKEFIKLSGYKTHIRVCSKPCYNKMIEKQWKNAREATLKRDDYTCQICGEKEGRLRNGKPIKLEVHHLDETGSNIKSKDMNNRLSNLITLCHRCHMNEEIKLKGSFSNGNTPESVKGRNVKILELYDKGFSQTKIARLFNITRQRVNHIIKKNKI